MQGVFAIAAVTLFVPVLYHRQRNEEVSGLDANAPGEDVQLCRQMSSQPSVVFSVPAPAALCFLSWGSIASRHQDPLRDAGSWSHTSEQPHF